MSAKDGRAIARENEKRILRALHRFGWLRTRDLAVLVWQPWAMKAPSTGPCLRPRLPTAAALRMAQRTLSRLRKRRQVLSSRAPDGSTLYALAEAGARTLQTIGIGAASGKDLLREFSSSHYRHRSIANEIAIAAIVDGFRVSTEREIARGRWFGGMEGVSDKLPDVILRDSHDLWWIEVERSRKNATEYKRLLGWLDTVLRDAIWREGPPLLGVMKWAKVIFVCKPAFRDKLTRDLLDREWSEKEVAALILFECSLYLFKDISFS